MGRTCGKNGRGKIGKESSNAHKVEGKGGEEDRDCDGRTVKEWEENGEQPLHIGGV